MIKLFAKRWLRTFSQRYDYDIAYMAAILEHSPAALAKLSTMNLLAAHRRGIPAAPWWAARIRAALWEDCGPCVQLACNMALDSGVDAAIVSAVITSDLAALDEDCALALQFTEAVLAHSPDAEHLRDEIRRRWREEGLISLAVTISATRVYPTVKYVLGHGQACQRVNIQQRFVTPASPATLFETATGVVPP